jgi:flagellar biosynthesis GTPase FlhF
MQIALKNPSAYGALLTTIQSQLGVELSPAALAIADKGLQAQLYLDAIAPDLELGELLEVDSDDTLEEAQLLMGRMAAVSAARTGKLDAERLALTEPFRLLTAKINEGYAAAQQHVAGVKDKLGARVLSYHAQKQREAEAKAAEERRQREEQARQEAERAAAERAAAEATAKQAQLATEAGQVEVAEVLIQQSSIQADSAREAEQRALDVVHRPTYAASSSVKGARTTYGAELTDAKAFVLFVAERLKAGDDSWLTYLTPNASAMTKRAQLEKENFKAPEGWRATKNVGLSTRKAEL